MELDFISNYIPNIEDIYKDRTLYVKDMETYLEKLKKEKENKTMSNTANLGKSLTETLKEGMKNFADWANAMTTLLNSGDELNNNIETIKEFDSALTDLKKVSEETVKAATEK